MKDFFRETTHCSKNIMYYVIDSLNWWFFIVNIQHFNQARWDLYGYYNSQFDERFLINAFTMSKKAYTDIYCKVKV